MTEKEKRLSGVLYSVKDEPNLISDMDKCKDACYEFNMIKPSHLEERADSLKKLFKKVGSIKLVQSPFYCDLGYNIEVGENFYANHGLTILDTASVKFGDNIYIGPYCGFHTAGHPIDTARRNLDYEYAHPITVGDNVWFGANVQVLPGVTIGSNVVIGSGSIVNKNIPDNVVAVGNPCRVLRSITKDDELNDYAMKNLQK